MGKCFANNCSQKNQCSGKLSENVCRKKSNFSVGTTLPRMTSLEKRARIIAKLGRTKYIHNIEKYPPFYAR